MTLALQSLLSGLVNGAVYALMGVAIVLCFRSSRVVNLAQGETFTVSGLLTAKLTLLGLPLAGAGLVGVAAAVVGSLLLERLVLRPRLHWPPARLIIVTLGVAFLVEGVAYRVVGADQYSFPPMAPRTSLLVANAAISAQGVLVVAVALAASGLLVWFFRGALLGQAMSACAENPSASALLGINVGALRQLSYGVAGLLGGVSALLLIPLGNLTYDAGLTMTLNGFVAAAFANMRHPGRALFAGLALGVGEGFVGSYVNPLFETPVVFGIFLIIGVLYLSRQVRFGEVARA